MNRSVYVILKRIGLNRRFFLILLLRSPFDLLNAVITANMLERFILLSEAGDAGGLARAFLLFLGVSVLLFTYNMIVWSTVSIDFGIEFHKRLRRTMLGKILSFDQSRLDRFSSGDIITRLNSDIDKAELYLGGPLNTVHMTCALVNMACSSVILIRLSLRLYIIAMSVMLPFLILNTVVITAKIPVFKRKAQDSFARFTGLVAPAVSCQPVIRIYEGEELLERKAEELSLEIMRNNMKAHNRIAWSFFCNTFSGILGYVLLLLTGNSMIGEEISDFARLSKITQYRGTVMQSAMTVTSCAGNRRTNLTGALRVNEMLSERDDHDG